MSCALASYYRGRLFPKGGGDLWSDDSMAELVDRALMCVRLAQAEPTLAGAPGTGPWDCGDLDSWAATLPEDHPARHAALRVLNAWIPDNAWQSEVAS